MALPQAGRGSALFTRPVRATESAPRILACLPWSRYTDSDPIERFWARSSAGEHYLDMVGVTGSIPVVPTIAFNSLLTLCVLLTFLCPSFAQKTLFALRS